MRPGSCDNKTKLILLLKMNSKIKFICSKKYRFGREFEMDNIIVVL